MRRSLLTGWTASLSRPAASHVPHSDLLAALAEYQEELRETDPDQLIAKPETYLTDWSGPDKLWLRRFLEAGRDEPVYQLTPATEDVFVFLDRVLEQDPGFVGTESRLKLVIDTLDDLVVGASEDPEDATAASSRNTAASPGGD